MPTADVNGTTIYYERSGRGSPLVLIPREPATAGLSPAGRTRHPRRRSHALRRQHVERARHRADLARRRYLTVDPDRGTRDHRRKRIRVTPKRPC